MNPGEKLFNSFSAPSLEDWKTLAAEETGNVDPLDHLQWNTTDQLAFLPYYTAEQVSTLDYLEKFTFTAGNEFASRFWHNVPSVNVASEQDANGVALEHLHHEAEGVLFRTSGNKIDFNRLLQEISWEHCNISFLAENDFPIDKLLDFIGANRLDLNKIRGSIFHQSLPKLKNSFLPESTYQLLGIQVPPSSPVREICEVLLKGTSCINHLMSEGAEARRVISQIAFLLPVGEELLLEIAKLKAARILWFQVARAYGITDYDPNDLHLHVCSYPWANQQFQPHGNMLKSTLATIAGISGGCNAITVMPENEKSRMMNRIARNTSVILRDESHLGKVNDPFAGSYTINALTDALSKEAWKKFQSER